MGFLFRLTIYTIAFYLLFKYLRKMFTGGGKQEHLKRERPASSVTPPPYDPTNVEDIDYREVKPDKKGKRDGAQG